MSSNFVSSYENENLKKFEGRVLTMLGDIIQSINILSDRLDSALEGVEEDMEQEEQEDSLER